MGYYNDFMGGFGWIGLILMILFWSLIIWAIVALIRSVSSKNNHYENSDHEAIRIIKERYARGEINKKEFDEKKRDLLK